MMQFDCGSLVPGCTWHAEATERAEIVRRAVEHLRQAHGETEIRPSIVEQVKARIYDADLVRS